MANSKSTNDETSNDGLALIIGGLFVLALVFATYSYFNRSSTTDQDILSDSTENTEVKEKATLGERLRELFSGQDNDDMQGKGGPMDIKEEIPGADTDSVFAKWIATDYQEGDISGSSYIVKSGDTLWEIAEARYGNGADWTKILDTNSSDIGYLPNGQQALIVPGQTLVLP